MFDPPLIQRPTRRLIDTSTDSSTTIRRPEAQSFDSAPRVAQRPSPAAFQRGLGNTTPASVAQRPALPRALSSAPSLAAAPNVSDAPSSVPGIDRALSRAPFASKPTPGLGNGQHGAPVYDQASVARVMRPQVNRALVSPPAQPVAARPEPAVQRTLTQTQVPNVASTFGQPVTAMADNFPGLPIARRPDVALRGPDAMAEQYNSSEDREARRKLLGDLDSQRFRLEMRHTRSAREALAQNAQQQAALVGGGERLSSEAINARNQQNTMLANTGLEQGGQDRRAQFQVQASTANADADRAQELGIARMSDATRRAEIAAGQIPRSEYKMLHDGTLLTVTGNKAARVTDADGNQVRLPVQDPAALSGDDLLKAYTDQRNAIMGLAEQLSPDELGAHFEALDESLIGQRYQQALGGGVPSQRSGRTATPAPKVGTVMQGFRFKGGDPADPASWEPAQ